MDNTLGVCGDTFEELVTRAYSRAEHNLIPIFGWGFGVCVWSQPTEYLLWVHFCGYLLRIRSFDDDACFGN